MIGLIRLIRLIDQENQDIKSLARFSTTIHHF